MSKPVLCDRQSLTKENLKNDERPGVYDIKRRGIESGCIKLSEQQRSSSNDKNALWRANEPIFLPKLLGNTIAENQHYIDQSKKLYQSVLAGNEIEHSLDQPDYLTRFGEKFELLSSRFDEADRQEIVSLDFDVLENGELIMEDIWMRVSWLSYIEDDESLRFRFSFGMEGFDDVSLDVERQKAAADLCECIFPESVLISKNTSLIETVTSIVQLKNIDFLERIIYFNAKNGGAQFHHDAEKGHVGVVYAQVTGQTLWLALSKAQLISEINDFLKKPENIDELQQVVSKKTDFDNLMKSAEDSAFLETLLDDPGNDEISELLNHSPRFFSQMINQDYGYILNPGDVILLPQENQAACAWHSVFCLGDVAGEALSFAIKESVSQ